MRYRFRVYADHVTIPAFPAAEVLAARQKLVLDHFHDEVRQAWDDVLSTFPHPRYELIPQMLVHDGDVAVREYYAYTRTAFPDQDHERPTGLACQINATNRR